MVCPSDNCHNTTPSLCYKGQGKSFSVGLSYPLTTPAIHINSISMESLVRNSTKSKLVENHGCVSMDGENSQTVCVKCHRTMAKPRGGSRNMPWLLIVSFIYLFWIKHTDGFLFGSSDPSPVVVEPKLIEVEEGQSFEVTCRITKTFNGTYTVRDMHFTKHRNYHVGHPYFQVVSDMEAKLHIPSAVYGIWKGILWCDIYNITANFLHITEKAAKVVFRRDPLEPEITSCVVNNWENLECRWSPSRIHQLNHTDHKHNFRYKFMWSFGGDHHEHYCCSDPQLAQCPMNATNLTESCVLQSGSRVNPFLMGGLYRLKVRAETDKDFEVAKWGNGTIFNTTIHVKPRPPSNVTMDIVNKTHALVRWVRPVSSWLRANNWRLNYSIQVYSMSQHTTKDPLTVYTNETQALIAVHPHTTYTIHVKVIPIVGGYWSSPAAVTLQIPPAVPDMNPVVFPGSYEYENKACSVRCGVTIYWQPLAQHELHGNNPKYIIQTRSRSIPDEYRGPIDSEMPKYEDWKAVKSIRDSHRSSFTMDIITKQTVEVAVLSRNDIGMGPEQNQLIQIVEKEQLLNVEGKLVVEGSPESTEVLLWLDSPNQLDNTATYTAFWQSRNKHTGDTVGWLDLPHDSPKAKVNLTAPYDEYRYAIAKVVGDMNSGLVWKPDCKYSYAQGAKVAAPSDVKVIERSKSSLTLTWAPPGYRLGNQYITHYNVYFCAKDQHTDSCKKPVRQHKQWFHSSETRAVLDDLPQNTQYIVTMTSQGRNGESESVTVTGVTATLAGLTTGAILGIVLGCVLGLVFFIIMGIGVYTFGKKCVAVKKWFNKGIIIKMPDDNTHGVSGYRESTSSETPFLTGFNGYNNNPYKRQTSMLSDTSLDSGQFSIPLDDQYTDDMPLGCTSYSRGLAQTSNGLKCIPEDEDDVFTSSCKDGLKTYSCVTDAYAKDDTGISKYATIAFGDHPGEACSYDQGIDQQSGGQINSAMSSGQSSSDSEGAMRPQLPPPPQSYVPNDGSFDLRKMKPLPDASQNTYVCNDGTFDPKKILSSVPLDVAVVGPYVPNIVLTGAEENNMDQNNTPLSDESVLQTAIQANGHIPGNGQSRPV